MSFPLDDDAARDYHDVEIPAWRQPAATEILLGAAAPTLEQLLAKVSEVLGEQAPAQIAEFEPDMGGPALVVEYRGVRMFVRTAADALGPEDAAEGADFQGAIAFPADNPSFQGPLNAARGLAIWNSQAAVLLQTQARIRVAGEVFAPPPDGPTADQPLGADPYLEALREELAVATLTAVLLGVTQEPIAVWIPLAGMTLPAAAYRDTVVNSPLPVPVLVGVRVGVYTESAEQETPVTFAFTTGMFRFGRADMEFTQRPTTPQDTLGAMFDLIAFELGTASIFEPGTPVDLQDGRIFDLAVGQSPITGWNLLLAEQRGTAEPGA